MEKRFNTWAAAAIFVGALAGCGAADPGVESTASAIRAGKTTICHATGSATNPYVEITISDNALPAHMNHQDGRDIIPAPADGCPGVHECTCDKDCPDGQRCVDGNCVLECTCDKDCPSGMKCDGGVCVAICE